MRLEANLSGHVGATFPLQALQEDPVPSGAETRQTCGGLTNFVKPSLLIDIINLCKGQAAWLLPTHEYLTYHPGCHSCLWSASEAR